MNQAACSGTLRTLNLVGSVSGNLGLGVAARALGHAALARGYDVHVLDLDAGAGRGGVAIDRRFSVARSAGALPSGINVIVLPPLGVVDLLECSDVLTQLLARPDCFNALFTFWELPVLPPLWARALELFDAVVAPSGYIEAAMDLALSGCPVVRGLTPLELPDGIQSDRARFGLPADAFVAVTSFDPLSDPQRKNPAAAIEAFRRAFPVAGAERLVVKLNAPKEGYPDPELNRTVLQPLLDDLRADERVIVMSGALPYGDVLSLYASADAFVSLHRAEGLGLGLLEAMALGKPVVATGWSGNKVFLSPGSACVVRHALVPVTGTHEAYRATQAQAPLWAEPDVDDAAAWLRRLAADGALRARIGSAALAAFSRYQAEATRLGFVDDLTALHQHRAATDTAPQREARDRAVRELRRTLQRARMTAAQRLGSQVRDGFERHIAWRLAAARATTK